MAESDNILTKLHDLLLYLILQRHKFPCDQKFVLGGWIETKLLEVPEFCLRAYCGRGPCRRRPRFPESSWPPIRREQDGPRSVRVRTNEAKPRAAVEIFLKTVGNDTSAFGTLNHDSKNSNNSRITSPDG